MYDTILQIIGFLVAVFFGCHVIRWYLKDWEFGDDDKGLKGAGRIIGCLERGITYIFASSGEYGAISFILAAKSITRFNELKDRKFAEYYLIGTLMSILFAIIVVLGVKWVSLYSLLVVEDKCSLL